MITMAAKLGMSREEFSKCLKDSKYETSVKNSIGEAARVGIDRTPTFVINGTVFIGGPSLDTFKGVINEALREKGIRTRNTGKTK